MRELKMPKRTWATSSGIPGIAMGEECCTLGADLLGQLLVGQCDGHGIFLYFVSAYVYTQDRIPHMHIHICKYRQYVNVNTPQTFIDYI